ncbi:DME family drug/metabolite transporter [Thermosporothrix hazakensis]|jgi:DME family drug/metabolite transporter|uniref:DME family drug/metabolite transporter n=1 Tax=Thermosporothrix hazakensis TaxID=644383 RepID=A0A326USQ1_THEHA|nr:DMT family transporter [Thermosporothrix hazakensis]PZW34437.1 DME family drug/metabolite transporter [Thermosporothrix hazakensis]GCE46014.1 hypothetical protein KTH_08830 [Thermosporothrix hazakensis]
MRHSRASLRSLASGGAISILLGSFFLGTAGIASALLNRVQDVSPLTIAFLRVGIATPFLFLLAWPSMRKQRIHLPDLFLLTLIGGALGGSHTLFFLSIPLIGVTLAVVISLCTAPLVVALVSAWLFHERPGVRLLIALLLALAGTLLLTLSGENATGIGLTTQTLNGTLIAFGSGCFYAVFMLFSKIVAQRSRSSSSQITAWTFLMATLLLFLLALVSGNLHLALSLTGWTIAAYMGIVPTGLAYFLIQWGLRSASATVASIITLLESGIAALLSWLFLHEQMGALRLIGGGLLLFSVWLISSKRNKTA